MGATPPIEVAVEPNALLQLSAVPTNIVYQPPSGWDANSFQTTATNSTEVTVSMGTQNEASQAVESSRALEIGAKAGIPDIFNIEVKYGQKWNTKETSTTSTETNDSRSLSVTTSQQVLISGAPNAELVAAGPGLRPVPPGSNIHNDWHAPWLYDQVFFVTGMHVALFGLNTCKDGSAPGYYPDGGQYFNAAEQKLVTAPRCEGEAR